MKWYSKAAEQGDARAQHNLDVIAAGRGVTQDDKEAVKRYREAAEQGDAKAQFNLGVMYANGRGVTQDYIQAHKWLNLSDSQGSEDAAKGRDLVAGKMSSEQIAEAQRLASEWRKP